MSIVFLLAIIALVCAILALIPSTGPVPWGGIAVLILAVIACFGSRLG